MMHRQAPLRADAQAPAEQRVFAADAESIDELGVGRWRTAWRCPVSEDSFLAMADSVGNRLARLLAEATPAARDMLLADVVFVLVHLIQHMHAREVESLCASGTRFVYGPASAPVVRPDWAALGAAHDAWVTAGRSRRQQLRGMAKSVLLNRPAALVRAAAAGRLRPDAWAIGSRSWLRAEYVAKRGLLCRYDDADVILAETRAAIGENPSLLRPALSAFVSDMDRLLKDRCGARLDRDRIVSAWWRRLSTLAPAYNAIAARRDLPATLLLTNQGIPLNRTIALAARRRGVRVVGFSHGNEPGNVDVSGGGAVQHAPCNEFVCISKASADVHADNYRTGGLAGLYPVSFTSAATRHYLDLSAQASRRPLPAAVRRVMVMGYPLVPHRYSFRGGLYFPYQLDIQMRMIELLIENGFTALYKAHPEMKGAGDSFFRDLGAEVIPAPFEQAWSEADALIFTYPLTSTFGVALCTNRPIIVLDVEGLAWNPEPLALLRDRCTLIPASYDDRDRIRFDTGALVEALRRPTSEPDQSYVRRMMSDG